MVSMWASSSSYRSSVTYPPLLTTLVFTSNTAQPSVKQ